MRTPTILLGLILFATVVCAANVTLMPASIYETTSVWEALDVNNHRGSSVISEVSLRSPMLILDAANYSGWTKTQTQYGVLWDDGTIETNMKSALFEFKISAPAVVNDTVVVFNATLDASTTALALTILNDATPPSITNVRPSSYARANNAMQAISATVVDAETSVESVTYTWNDCNGGPDIPIVLLKSADTYNGVANFSQFDEGEKVCYVVKAKNVPGEIGNVSGELLFDGTEPFVNITSPTDYATESTDFVFTASDNIASVLSCTLFLDNTELRTVNVTNGSQASVTENLSGFTQGSHTWSVTCQDGVGLSATHAQVIQLDTAAPVITLDVQSTLPRTQSLQFTVKVIDTVSLASVSATFDGNNLTLTQSGDYFSGTISSDVLGDKTLVIRAEDSAGHVTTVSRTITIVPNHLLTLHLSPGSASPGASVTASGRLTPEGNVSATSVTVKTPGGDIAVDLADNDYSTVFTAPSAGTYVITAEFREAGHVYSASATLSVQGAQSSAPEGSHGYQRDWSGGSSYVKPEEVQQGEGSQNSEMVTPEPETAPQPAPYVPLQQVPEPEREAFVPKATGVFNLNSTIKWFALLLALALIVGLGAYAYSKRRPKDDSGIDWDGYFKGNGA